MDFVFVYMTAAAEDEGQRIARALVGERLAACANVIPGMTAVYWWQGKMEEGRECVVVAKTRRTLVEALTRRVRELHSYSCPCVVVLPIVDGNPAYLAWIGTETAEAPPA